MKQYLAQIWRLLNLPKAVQLFIMRFVNDEFLVGVTGVILNKKNEILLLKHTYRQTPWSLPGGYLQKGEHPMEGVEREILEETGFIVKIEKIIRTSHDKFNPRLDISCYGYFVRGKFIPSAEVTEYGFFTFENLPNIGKRQKKLIEKVLREEKGFFSAKQTLIDHFSSFFKKRNN